MATQTVDAEVVPDPPLEVELRGAVDDVLLRRRMRMLRRRSRWRDRTAFTVLAWALTVVCVAWLVVAAVEAASR